MSEQLIANLNRLLASGQDNALLRFSLGSAYAKNKQHSEAIEHLARAVEHDPDYSAAWKIYGKTLATSGDNETAKTAYQHGIEAAERNGHIQTAKEIKVFLKRLNKLTTG